MINMNQAISTIPMQYYIIFCSLLFVIGVAGVLIKRNALVIFMSVEIMLNSINLLLVAFSVYHNDPGLALVVMVYRHTHSIDINFLNKLKW
jgi:NADH-quinone oxidoreductase subunit K